MNNKYEAPPIGIIPKRFHDEARLFNLKEAIDRYKDANLRIPPEWIYEYNDLVKKLNKNNTCGERKNTELKETEDNINSGDNKDIMDRLDKIIKLQNVQMRRMPL